MSSRGRLKPASDSERCTEAEPLGFNALDTSSGDGIASSANVSLLMAGETTPGKFEAV